MFIGKEISFLENEFDIDIAPILISNKIEQISKKIKIDYSLNSEINKKRLKRALQVIISFKFINEIFIALKLKKIPNIISIIHYTDLFNATNKWIKKNNVLKKYDVIYTYWLSAATEAISSFDQRPLIISRVHGYDIYEDRNKNNYIVGLRASLNKIDMLFTISNHAINYINKNFRYKCKIILARLGVPTQKLIDGNLPFNLHLVSCSSVIQLKRVYNIFNAVMLLSDKFPNLEIKWSHIGDGIEMINLKNLINKAPINNNLKIQLLGNLSNSEVIGFYLNNKIDLFLHASETEGLPVSMQEAQSFGIPIISTNVGGISEIVIEGTGYLVDLENSAQELKDRIIDYINSNNHLQIRESAQKNQIINFNMEINYRKFTEHIKQNIK
jgi:colanic acid/amylovoran biosynthesis glycosyltransferase